LFFIFIFIFFFNNLHSGVLLCTNTPRVVGQVKQFRYSRHSHIFRRPLTPRHALCKKHCVTSALALFLPRNLILLSRSTSQPYINKQLQKNSTSSLFLITFAGAKYSRSDQLNRGPDVLAY